MTTANMHCAVALNLLNVATFEAAQTQSAADSLPSWNDVPLILSPFPVST